MLVTVAICTWNRAALLDKTLAALQHLEISNGVRWELLVVNNNCTDDTDQVLSRYQNVLPLRKLSESKPGLARARNCAIKAAAGEWILWTDDDVLVNPDWLESYVEAIQANPACAYVGGTIDPWFETPPPRWLGRHLPKIEGAFAIIRRDSNTRKLKIEGNVEESIFGANMGIRTELLKKNLFDTNLGLAGKNLIRGEETEMFARLERLGHHGLWVGNAKVKHFIPTTRMTTQYLWNFFFGCGQAQARLSNPIVVSTILGRPRWAVRAYLESLTASQALFPVKNSLWLHHFQRAAICAGIMRESYDLQITHSSPH